MRSVLALALAVSALLAQPQAEPLLKNAITLHQSGDYSGAIRLYQQYLKVRPDSLDALSNLGAALAHEGRFTEAIAEYNQALKIQPKNPQALANLALAYYKTGRISEAREKLERVRPLLPNNQQVAFLLADCYLRLGDYQKAIALLDPWEKEMPNDPGLSYLLGTALMRDQQTERGSQVIDRILRHGDSAEARLLLATAKLNAHDIPGAREDLEKAIELNPRLPEAHSYLGLPCSTREISMPPPRRFTRSCSSIRITSPPFSSWACWPSAISASTRLSLYLSEVWRCIPKIPRWSTRSLP